MSFMSMLQMAKGKEPPPVNKPSRPMGELIQKPTADRPTQASAARPALSASMRPQETPNRPETAPIYRAAANKGNSTQDTSQHRNKTLGSRPAPQASAMSGVASASSKSTPSTPYRRQLAPSNYSKSPRLEASARLGPPASSNSRAAASAAPAAAAPGRTAKRISFKDAMKKATSIDKSKLEISLKTTDSRKQQFFSARARDRAHKHNPAETNAATNAVPKGDQSRSGRRESSNPTVKATRPSRNKQQPHPAPAPKSKAPFAQPNAALMEKYKAKKNQQQSSKRGRYPYDEDDEEELDDFVVSEDDDGGEIDPRSEIWSLYNRHPRQQYYSDSGSDDDMEATGMDIFNEETKSALQARREDLEEEKKLEQLQRRKMSKLG